MQIAPPLISDAALLDEIVDRLGEVLTDAGKQIGLGQTHLAQPVPA
jgi:adenosylmethionine-8-amino-7-oxononanoate aminotransferase